MELTYLDAIEVADYNRLREGAGWGALIEEQARAGLIGSRRVVACRDGARVVGVARLIWDGGYSAYICDVIVEPACQGRGIGTEMMNRLMGYLRGQLRPGWRITVALLAAKGKEPFYGRFGAGMFQRIVEGETP